MVPQRGQPSDFQVVGDLAVLALASALCATIAAVFIKPDLLRRLVALEPVPWHRRLVIEVRHRWQRR